MSQEENSNKTDNVTHEPAAPTPLSGDELTAAQGTTMDARIKTLEDQIEALKAVRQNQEKMLNDANDKITKLRMENGALKLDKELIDAHAEALHAELETYRADRPRYEAMEFSYLVKDALFRIGELQERLANGWVIQQTAVHTYLEDVPVDESKPDGKTEQVRRWRRQLLLIRYNAPEVDLEATQEMEAIVDATDTAETVKASVTLPTHYPPPVGRDRPSIFDGGDGHPQAKLSGKWLEMSQRSNARLFDVYEQIRAGERADHIGLLELMQ